MGSRERERLFQLALETEAFYSKNMELGILVIYYRLDCLAVNLPLEEGHSSAVRFQRGPQ